MTMKVIITCIDEYCIELTLQHNNLKFLNFFNISGMDREQQLAQIGEGISPPPYIFFCKSTSHNIY